MMRLLFWCLIGAVLYAGLRKISGSGGAASSGDASRNAVGAGRAEDMVRCRVCGLNLPKSEALAVGRQWACCAQHARDAGSDKPT